MKKLCNTMVTEEIKPEDIMAEESWEEGWKEEDWEIVEINSKQAQLYEALLNHFLEVDKLIISLSSNPVTFYSKDMKLEEAKRKLIDAKNKGIIGNERHFFDKRALERGITPREIGEVIDSCEVLEEQIQKMYPRLRYKIKGITSSGRELMLIVAVTKDGYLYVKTGWEV